MRSKTGTVRRKKHHKIIKQAKGFRMTKGRLVKVSKEAVIHAGQYAYNGRRIRKRDLRKLWILRINAALKESGLKYKDFIFKLRQKKIELDRKILSHLAVTQPKIFNQITKKVI